MPGCEGRRYTLEFCGRGAKENILVHKLWLELTILIGADATLLPEHEDQVKPPTTLKNRKAPLPPAVGASRV